MLQSSGVLDNTREDYLRLVSTAFVSSILPGLPPSASKKEIYIHHPHSKGIQHDSCMQRDCLITRIFRLARRPGVRDRLVPNISIQHHPTLVLRIGGSKQTIISETRAVRRHTELNTLTPTRSPPPDPDTPCALGRRVSTPCGRAQFARRGTLQNTHSKSTNRLRSLRKFLRNKRRVVIAALPALPSKTNKFHPTDVHSSTSYANHRNTTRPRVRGSHVRVGAAAYI